MVGGICPEKPEGIADEIGGGQAVAAGDFDIDGLRQCGKASDGVDIFGGPSPIERAGFGQFERAGGQPPGHAPGVEGDLCRHGIKATEPRIVAVKDGVGGVQAMVTAQIGNAVRQRARGGRGAQRGGIDDVDEARRPGTGGDGRQDIVVATDCKHRADIAAGDKSAGVGGVDGLDFAGNAQRRQRVGGGYCRIGNAGNALTAGLQQPGEIAADRAIAAKDQGCLHRCIARKPARLVKQPRQWCRK